MEYLIIIASLLAVAVIYKLIGNLKKKKEAAKCGCDGNCKCGTELTEAEIYGIVEEVPAVEVAPEVIEAPIEVVAEVEIPKIEVEVPKVKASSKKKAKKKGTTKKK